VNKRLNSDKIDEGLAGLLKRLLCFIALNHLAAPQMTDGYRFANHGFILISNKNKSA
jgi:hypothetical protein